MRIGTAEERKVETTLGAQMTNFEKKVKECTGKLQGLQGRWEAVGRKIEVLGEQLKTAEGGGGAKGGYAAEIAKVRGEYASKRENCVMRYDEKCKNLADEVEKFEKVRCRVNYMWDVVLRSVRRTRRSRRNSANRCCDL